LDEEISRSVFETTFSTLSGKRFYLMLNDTRDTIIDIWYNRFELPEINPGELIDCMITVAGELEAELYANKLSYIEGQLIMGIKNKTNTFEADELDSHHELWVKGLEFFHEGMNLGINHSFERLICTNGCVVNHRKFATNISTKYFNPDLITRKMAHYLHFDNEFKMMIQDQVKKLKEINASLHEYLIFRNLFKSHNLDTSVAEKYFPIRIHNEVYDCNVLEKSSRWLSTADSGMNAFDLFNHITYISSHDQECKDIPAVFATTLQIASSSLLMKHELDLKNIAPKVQINLN